MLTETEKTEVMRLSNAATDFGLETLFDSPIDMLHGLYHNDEAPTNGKSFIDTAVREILYVTLPEFMIAQQEASEDESDSSA